MFRLLHPASHRVNPIAQDFDSGVQLVRLKLSQQQQHQHQLHQLSDAADYSPPEFQRRASGGSASMLVSADDVDMLTDVMMTQSPSIHSPSPRFPAGAARRRLMMDGIVRDAEVGIVDTSATFADGLVSTPVPSIAKSNNRAATGGSAVGAASKLQLAVSQPDAAAAACLDELRHTRPRRFYEICRVHLAFVTDVPADFLQDVIDSCQQQQQQQQQSCTARRTPSAAGNLLERVCRSVRQHTAATDAVAAAAAASAIAADEESLSDDILAGVERLIRLLESRLDAEGIFRKSGQIGRQRQLRRRLFTEEPADSQAASWLPELAAEAVVSELRCCVHDIAGVLKACLADLRQPLLTDRLGPYFLQVAGLNSHRLDENGNPLDEASSLAAARQLRGFRILVQLLPINNRRMLRSLLQLLCQVASLPRTLMTPENLGTVFGPLLLCPRQMQSTDNYTQVIGLCNEAVTYMIRNADEVFKIPEHLIIDAMRGLAQDRSRCCSRSVQNSTATADAQRSLEAIDSAADTDADIVEEEDEAVDVCVAFVDRTAASQLNGREYTQLQVAQLYAAVQAMPDCSRKAALVRKFSAAANVADATEGPAGNVGASSSTEQRHRRRRLCVH